LGPSINENVPKKFTFCIKYKLTLVIGTKKEGSHANVNCKLGLGQVVSPLEEEQGKQQGPQSRGKPGNCQLCVRSGACSLTSGRGAREAARLPFKSKARQMSTVSKVWGM
jgi:hypothetical protein